MTKILQTSCVASLSGSVISSVAWADNITSIVGMIGTIISAVFGLLSLIILIYQRVKKKADDGNLTAKDLLDAIKEGKDGAKPYIDQIKKAVKDYESQKSSGNEDNNTNA